MRTTPTANVNQVEGWSFGLKHAAPTLIGIGGGNFVPRSAQAGPCLSTLQAGSPPDFEGTKHWDCGLAQGVVLDFHATHHTIGPTTNLVTAYACYRLTFPTNSTVHQVTLSFGDDVGDPPVENLVMRAGAPTIPCKETLVINVYPTTSTYPTPSYCPFATTDAAECEPAQGGGAGTPLVDGMIEDGVQFLLANMVGGPCNPSFHDRWLWNGNASPGGANRRPGTLRIRCGTLRSGSDRCPSPRPPHREPGRVVKASRGLSRPNVSASWTSTPAPWPAAGRTATPARRPSRRASRSRSRPTAATLRPPVRAPGAPGRLFPLSTGRAAPLS